MQAKEKPALPQTDQITLPELRSRASLRTILNSFVSRLREFREFNSGNTVITDQVIPRAMPLGRLGLTVSFGDGQFPEGPWRAAHHRTAATETRVAVGIFIQTARDRAGRSETAIVDDGSILDYFEQVLLLLTVSDDSLKEDSQAWEPSKNGVPLLKSIPIPESFTSASDVPGHQGWIGMQLQFAIEFDWDLYR
jgi:hypothetical protein